ncbi:nucleotidyltransferase domain-containing protein [Saccharolobus solfataricus]|nr:nucleotidyltransferase domain-containing protein [Saccharolobus solfataricus]AKA72984.1 nucleotidyltransferase domain-containing protein [Saccharolobus solfataricus]AKA75683.1 nucleotidyltransferase domain-containing protein [Saccharolobus solfataricus]AKA80393.1 nucleotidyltransferase domain-containing protein [Saccharolobus solfataricus]AZF67495.1 nucleotidyltransferase domain-containing protein [Saccharolobus solfataricus]AZF70115.1 nucleotidyltransferase domain-containing protein [Sacch
MIKEPYAKLLNDMVKIMREEFKDDLISVVLYGSVARGDNRNDSDVDLLIVIDNLPMDGILKRIRLFETKVEDKLNLDEYWSKGYYISLSPILKTPEEAGKISPLYLDMVYDAVILYDKDQFFTKILQKLKGRLMELGAERVRMGKRWYWILKKDSGFGETVEL